MRLKRPRPASPDQIRISREDDTAVIEYADPSIRGVHLRVGPALATMTDADVLELFNGMLEAQDEVAAGVDPTLLDALGKRLGRYGLTLHETKTRYVDFRRKRPYGRHWMASATTFDFLGFTHVWGRSMQGKDVVRQITAKGRFARAEPVNDFETVTIAI